MRVFVPCTGRCGSTTLAHACSHIRNFSTAHESGAYLDWSYPDQHIEIDNRLSWFLGDLHSRYGDALFVRLHRDHSKVVESFARRAMYNSPGMLTEAYARGIVVPPFRDPFQLAEHLVSTIESNLELFFRIHVPVATIDIDDPIPNFRLFCTLLGAQGDLEQAEAEFQTRYNRG